jgi:hypothetical protein
MHKGVNTSLYVKACVPKDVACDTDILRACVYQCHQLLKGKINTKEQILTCYSSRTLTLFDIPIAYYIDASHTRLESREGGEFCVDRGTIARVCADHSFDFDVDALIDWLSKKFAERKIVDM